MATYCTCNERTLSFIHTNVSKLVKLINQFNWIIDAYVSDFYTHQLWDKLPRSVQEYFENVEPPDLVWMLATGEKVEENKMNHNCRLTPLSLLALRCCIQSLSLKRIAVDINSVETRSNVSCALCSKMCPKSETSSQYNDNRQSERGKASTKADTIRTPNYKNGQCMDMHHIFRKHVKPKKQHEIDRLGQTISILSQAAECKHIIDVGAGLGHLSRNLTFKHGLKVTTVEAADGHAPKAAALDMELKKDVHKAKVKRQVAFESTISVATYHSPTKECKNQTSSMEQPSSSPPSGSCNQIEVEGASYEKPRNNSTHSSGSNKCDLNSNHSNHQDIESKSSENISKDQNTRHFGECAIVGKNSERNENDSSVTSVGEFKEPQPSECHDSNSKSLDILSSERAEDEEEYLPSHVICKVQPDIAAPQFLDIVSHSLEGGTNSKDKQPTGCNFVLAGLHACGDLTPTLLRVFVNCPAAIGLASVACCYMKISSCNLESQEPDSSLHNYPMSCFVKGLPTHNLTYEAREMACHFADAYKQRLKDNPPHLKIHSYRAAFQKLITTINPDFKTGQVRFVSKKGAQKSFTEYAAENLKKVGMNIEMVPDNLLANCEQLTTDWCKVVAFYTLRLSLAPLVESLLLLDRCLYLYENGIQSVLVPIFEPSISPRNFALLAVKPRSTSHGDFS